MTGAARRGRHSWDGDMRNSELLSNDPVLLIRGVGVFLYRGSKVLLEIQTKYRYFFSSSNKYRRIIYISLTMIAIDIHITANVLWISYFAS